jgi:acid-sensing ion channel, other
MKFCNCSVGFLFPSVNYPECNVTQFLCLIKFNDILNAEKPQNKNPFFDENEDGITCSCLPECSRIEYSLEISPIYDEKKIDGNLLLIDVFYKSRVMMKYRTDVTFTGMELLVGFGGIVSLFLGCSVLSGAEIVYFSTIALFCHRKRSRIAQDSFVRRLKTRLPFIH